MTSFLYPMLAAYGFLDILPALIDFIRTRKWQIEKDNAFMNHQAFSMGLLGILFYLVIECFMHAYVIRNVTLSYASRDMMRWVRENTHTDGSFLLLTGRADVMTDAVQEWFLALANVIPPPPCRVWNGLWAGNFIRAGMIYPLCKHAAI